MDIENVRQKRRDLEIEIRDRLRAFQNETGARVTGIDVDVAGTGTIGAPDSTTVADVSVSVDL